MTITQCELREHEWYYITPDILTKIREKYPIIYAFLVTEIYFELLLQISGRLKA